MAPPPPCYDTLTARRKMGFLHSTGMHERCARRREHKSSPRAVVVCTPRASARMPLSVLQIGANSHHRSSIWSDPVPSLIHRGWSAILVEPQPQLVAALQDRYSSKQRADHVRILPAAVCMNASATSTRIWYLNGTATRSSNHSLVTCMGMSDRIHELASSSRTLLLSTQKSNFFTPSQCAACSKRLKRPLPPTCMSRAIVDNMFSFEVACVRSLQQLVALPIPSATLPERAPDALIVDAEGADAAVVARYLLSSPSHAAALSMVGYETSHSRSRSRGLLAKLLRQHGFQPFPSHDIASAAKVPAPAAKLDSLLWNSALRVVGRLARADLRNRYNAFWLRNSSKVQVSSRKSDHEAYLNLAGGLFT